MLTWSRGAVLLSWSVGATIEYTRKWMVTHDSYA